MNHLNQQQMAAILDKSRTIDPELYAMILIGWRHGLRASEVCQLRVGNFDLTATGGFLTVQRKKGSLRTTQPLFADEFAAVAALSANKVAEAFLFPGRFANRPVTRQTFFKKFQAVCELLSIPAHLAHPHTLKHTCGMTVIKNGIENCRQYLGHKSIASTGAYLRVSDEAASKAAQAAFAA